MIRDGTTYLVEPTLLPRPREIERDGQASCSAYAATLCYYSMVVISGFPRRALLPRVSFVRDEMRGFA
jgi:hypothetical protein